MIIDVEKFIREERKHWKALERMLDKLEGGATSFRLDMEQLKAFHALYQKAAADLGKLTTFASEPEAKAYLESLVARAYAEIHHTPAAVTRFRPLHWFFNTFPQTFRRHSKAFALSCLIMLVGSLFGACVIMFDKESKSVLMPFPHLLGDPSDRVAKEESQVNDEMRGGKALFSATLMTHNTKVSITTLCLGVTWGIGTMIMLFYNGIILGAVCADYVLAGESIFLMGWLLPHGAIEIPAILLAGQAGLVMAKALLGWKSRASVKMRFRAISGDLVTLIFGVGLMLIWAGLIESFLSQYHEPVFKYEYKILFGCIELALLTAFLWKSGSGRKREATA